MEEWENTLKEIFNEIDDYLEDMYGGLYPLHPSRSSRGATHDAVRILQTLLSEHYPDRNIRVEKDGSVFKIFGDLKILYKKPD